MSTDDPEELLAAFESARGTPVAPEQRDGVGASLSRLIRRGVAAHPELPLAGRAVAAHLGHLSATGRGAGALARELDAVHGADLHLALAGLFGVAGAVEKLDRIELVHVPSFVARLRPTPEQVVEIRQSLAVKLLVPEAGRAPRLAEYTGRGPLGAWIRVAAVRLAIDMMRQRADVPLAGEPAAGDGAGAGFSRGGASAQPEIEYLRRRYGEAFREALREAVATLPAEQRELLRLSVVEGLSGEEIAARRGVNRSTVWRWMSAARVAILDESRRRLHQRLGLAAPDFESLAGVLASQLELSIGGLLVPADAEPRS